MRLTFKSRTSSSCLTLDTDKKEYQLFSGIGSNQIVVDTNKELNKLEKDLIIAGYREV